ncbi:hypothetical protein LXL04_013124 [Taraxacum kok-saghyz]
MANEDGEPTYLKVDINMRGTFVRHPHGYLGERYLVTDMDLPALDFEGFVAFLERFIGETFEKLYYSQRNRPFKTGIRYIEDDVDYAMFLDTGFEAPEVPISIYLDHSGDGLAELFDSESDGSGHVTNGEESEKDPESGLPEEDQFPDAIRYSAGLEVEIIHDETVDANLNKTNGDEFLSKLCPVGGYVKDMDSITDGNPGTLFPKFNPNVNWRLQSPVLGMRFENPQQMKEMLCNYAVANGYQLSTVESETAAEAIETEDFDGGDPPVVTQETQEYDLGNGVGMDTQEIDAADGVGMETQDSDAGDGVGMETEDSDTSDGVGQETPDHYVAEEPVIAEPEELAVPQQPVRNVGEILNLIRRKKSERILKQKLAKNVMGKNGEGNSKEKPQQID